VRGKLTGGLVIGLNQAMSSKYVALLRGVNVGGKNKVSMAELRGLFESLGYEDVTTLIQSGNVVFAGGGGVKPRQIEVAIAKDLGVDAAVVLRTAGELQSVVEANPFTRVDRSKVHVGFMGDQPAAAVVANLDVDRFRPEEFVLHGRELYFHLPNGMGRAKLPPYLDRRLGVSTTIRTWTTVTKLLALAGRST
jgi:uncharacterized protein (DUF1697 family)